VHLKSLTLRGFKSFASSTMLHFEPGITCVVGPNGSGKSNVVDALAWVMGEQGAKSLRGGRMDDVIFAGTAGRPALGRAEVLLTIDNTDGALPIEYSEVTLSRTMFSGGGSEYAINGRVCRLLDVQELLSDSGIGREMHVVVGQGQLDSILTATPEERRGFVEEAAGVLKHRKRKEKALRKLDAMQANLTRVQDLTAELRRQLGPLGRQADIARRANVIQADLRDSRLRLLADDLVQAQTVLDRKLADELALQSRQSELSRALDEASAKATRAEAEIQQSAPRLARAQECWYQLAGLRERVAGTASLAAERGRHLAAAAEDRQARDVDALAREAAAVRGQEAELALQAAGARTALEAALRFRADSESALEAEERRLAGLIQAAADRREGVARLGGQVEGLRRRAVAADAELDRLRQAREHALSRAAAAEREFTALESTIAGLSLGEQGLDAEHDRLQLELEAAEEALSAALEEQRTAERERAALAARREALEIGLAKRDGAAALLAAPSQVDGLRGSIAALLAVEPGWEAAVATALGAAADALAVESVDDAVAALRRLRDDDLGRAGLLVATSDSEHAESLPRLPDGFRYLVDMVITPSWLRPAVAGLLRGVVAVDDLPAARAVVAELPTLVAVTPDGDLLSQTFAVGGSTGAPSALEVQAALDEAADRLTRASGRVAALDGTVGAARRQRDELAVQVGAALARLHESDAELAAVAEQLAELGHVARSAAAEGERLAAAAAEAEAARDRDQVGLSELEERLTAAEQPAATDPAPSTVERDRLSAAAEAARHAETEARLALRTVEERMRALTGRAESLEQAVMDESAARDEAVALAERRARAASTAAAVARGAAVVLDRLQRSLDLAAAQRADLERSRAEHERALSSVRESTVTLREELAEVTAAVHRDELDRAEQRMRVEALESKGLDEFGVDASTLVGEYGPDQPVPAAGDGDRLTPYDRDEQLKRAREAERALALLGRVNPLALEEFAALEERHAFLVEQLEDLRRTRRDLLDIVGEVDDRVQQIFAAAYEDTAREFADVFARLFPGGEGRLVLTEPDDMLATGIDVEARPPGKRIKRLSLLSGGERALVAVAFLIALFKARPSPFYVLDEVEAALDEVNLGRLLEIYEELRENSQLIVVTHQQRTMEIADALYGVSMRGDGVTALISQRIREAEPA
jgi:chromosome segregation protein